MLYNNIFMTVREVTFANEIPVDPDQATRAVFVHVDQGLFAPQGLLESFGRVNDLYKQDPGYRFRRMASGLITLENGLDLSFMHDARDEQTADLCVVFSPLNDGKPGSDPDKATSFVTQGSKDDVPEVKPNSHRPSAKLDLDYEFGHQEGLGMPRLQIFAREAPAMSSSQRWRVAGGDMTPYGELLLEHALPEANRVKHETYGTGDFRRIHLFAAGMGAKALGAAVHVIQNSDKYEIGSITLLNFGLDDESVPIRLYNYMRRRMAGEESYLKLPVGYTRVPEYSILTDLDKFGAEKDMRIRQIQAMSNVLMVRSIMNARKGVGYIELALENGCTITIANGANEAMNANTDERLPLDDPHMFKTDIVGVDGKKVGMAVNEHGSALTLVSNLGLYNHFSRGTK